MIRARRGVMQVSVRAASLLDLFINFSRHHGGSFNERNRP